MKRHCFAAVLFFVAVASAQVTVEKSWLYPKEGWAPGQWGVMYAVLKNNHEVPAVIGEVKISYLIDGKVVLEDEPFVENVTIKPGDTFRWGPWRKRSIEFAKKVGDKVPLLRAEVNLTVGDKTEVLTIEHKVPVTYLDEPLKLVSGRHIGFLLMESRFDNWKSQQDGLRWFDQCYEMMDELVGGKPRGGKLLILKEMPPIPGYAYSSDPIGLNTKYVGDVIVEMNNGILPFGYVHEMGHVFGYDTPKSWYSWCSATSEFQANFVANYAYENMDDKAWRLNWGDCRGNGLKSAGKHTPKSGRDFANALFLFFGDKYLADSTRTWDTMCSDEWHSFHLRLVRVYGWEIYRNWYRTYTRLAEAGKPEPETPEDKVVLTCAILSQAAGADLVPFFQVWRMPVTKESVDAAIEKYGLDSDQSSRVDPEDLIDLRKPKQ